MAGRLLKGQKKLLRGKLWEMVKQGKMRLKTASLELPTDQGGGYMPLIGRIQTQGSFTGMRENRRTGRRRRQSGNRL
jgi:hypothetical protein